MTKFFDEIFREGFNGEFLKRIQGMMNQIEKSMESGKIQGKWNVKQVDEPGIKGYVVQGRFWSDEPIPPFEPFEPLEPWVRRPMPKRPLNVPKSAYKEIRDPLTDVFEEENVVKIYSELPGEETDDIQLNVTEGKVEIKTKTFYKLIDVPKNIDVAKVSSKYKNGVLEIIIPKKKNEIKNQEWHKIDISN